MNRNFLVPQMDKIEEDATLEYSNSKKDWFAPANVALAQLERVKPRVYNIGLHDAKDLKTGAGRSRKEPEVDVMKTDGGTSLHTQPPLSTVSYQKAAWGNETCVPELFKRFAQAGTMPAKSARPSSAKIITATRPSSAKIRDRPQSAKDPMCYSEKEKASLGGNFPGRPDNGSSWQLKGQPQSKAVKGQKFEPSGRQDKSTVHHVPMGWAGPPAGLREPSPSSPHEVSAAMLRYTRAETPAPTVPHSSPEPLDDNTLDKEPVEQPPVTPVGLHLSLSLPNADDDDGPDTARLLDEADAYVRQQTDKKGKLLHADIPGCAGIGEALKTSVAALTQNKPKDSDNTFSHNSNMCQGVSILPTSDDIESLQNKEDGMPDDSCHKANDAFSKRYITGIVNVEAEAKHHENQNCCTSPIQLDLTSGLEDTVGPLPCSNGFDLEYLGPARQEKKARSHPIFLMPSDKLSLKAEVVASRPPQCPSSTNRKCRPASAGHAEKNEFDEKVGRSRSTLVHIREDCNVTVDITPRNLGRKVATLGKAQKKLQDDASRTVHKDWSSSEGVPLDGLTVDATACPTRDTTHKRPCTPVVVVFDDEDNDNNDVSNNNLKKLKQKRRHRVKADPVTMVSEIHLSDEEDAHPSQNADLEESNTVFSAGDKNYYDVGRKLKKNNIEASISQEEKENFITVTTKTILFDAQSPKESIVKTILDAPLLRPQSRSTSNLEKPPLVRANSAKRPGSAKQKNPQNCNKTDHSQTSSPVPLALGKDSSNSSITSPLTRLRSRAQEAVEERPGSRRGFVSMETEQSCGQEDQCLEADGDNTVRNHNSGEFKLDYPSLEKDEHPVRGADKSVSRLSSAVGRKSRQKSKEHTCIKQRPQSASATVSRTPNPADVERAKTAAQALRAEKAANAVPNPAARHGHYASYNAASKRRRPQSATSSVNHTVLVSKQPGLTVIETQDMLECKEMHNRLACYGLDIRPESLHRALYPPSGDTLYYELNVNLPKSYSDGLLSHPKHWLPTEYRKLQLAEKKLAMAELSLWRQQRAERGKGKRKGKKKGKKGKKNPG